MGGLWVERPDCDGLIFVIAFKVQGDELGFGVYGKDIAGEWHLIRSEDTEDKAQEIIHGYAEQLTAMRA